MGFSQVWAGDWIELPFHLWLWNSVWSLTHQSTFQTYRPPQGERKMPIFGMQVLGTVLNSVFPLGLFHLKGRMGTPACEGSQHEGAVFPSIVRKKPQVPSWPLGTEGPCRAAGEGPELVMRQKRSRGEHGPLWPLDIKSVLLGEF